MLPADDTSPSGRQDRFVAPEAIRRRYPEPLSPPRWPWCDLCRWLSPARWRVVRTDLAGRPYVFRVCLEHLEHLRETTPPDLLAAVVHLELEALTDPAPAAPAALFDPGPPAKRRRR